LSSTPTLASKDEAAIRKKQKPCVGSCPRGAILEIGGCMAMVSEMWESSLLTIVLEGVAVDKVYTPVLDADMGVQAEARGMVGLHSLRAVEDLMCQRTGKL